MASERRDLEYRERVEALIFNANVLHSAGFEFDELPSDVRAIYYSDFILLELLEAGAESFVETQLPLHPATENDVIKALERIGAAETSALFRRYFVGKTEINLLEANDSFAATRKRENVEALADALMLETLQIAWKPEAEVDAELASTVLDRKLTAQ